MKKMISIVLATIMSISAATAVGAVEYGEEYTNKPTKTYKQQFNDVSESHWAFSYIGEMTARAVVSGYPNGNFYPDNDVTRAEFARIMTSASGLPISTPTTPDFSDVAVDAWYAPYVHVAYPYLSGYQMSGGNYYKPDTPALREDIAVALVKLKGYDTLGADESILATMFTDVTSISADARKYVTVALERGLVSGYEDDTFRGQDSISRAEATAMLWRAYQYGNDNKIFDVEPTVAPLITTPTPVAMPTPVVTEKPTLVATEAPIIAEKPVPTPEPISTEEPIPTPQPVEKSEYSFELTTMIDGVDDISQMTATNKGIIYKDENKIMELKQDAIKEECIFDADKVEYLGDEELTKKELAEIETILHSIGYNQYDNCVYAIITQKRGYSPTYMIYNVTEEEKTGSFKEYWNTEGSNYPISDSNVTMEFNKSGQFCIGGGSGNKMEIPYMIDINEDVNEADQLVHIWQTYSFDNTLFRISKNTPYVRSNRTGEWEYVDYYCEELEDGEFFAVGRDGRVYYQASDSWSEQGIFSVDLEGNDYVVCYFDDIDNADGKIISLDAIEPDTSAVDDDGIIYYLDSNYNCIRQLKHK